MSEAGQIIWPVGIAVNDDPTRLVVDATDYDALRDENTRLVTEIKRRIWLLHGLRLMHNLYGDDGNMDCNSCFRRYAEATLEQCYEWEIADAAMIVTKAALNGGKGVQG